MDARCARCGNLVPPPSPGGAPAGSCPACGHALPRKSGQQTALYAIDPAAVRRLQELTAPPRSRRTRLQFSVDPEPPLLSPVPPRETMLEVPNPQRVIMRPVVVAAVIAPMPEVISGRRERDEVLDLPSQATQPPRALLPPPAALLPPSAALLPPDLLPAPDLPAQVIVPVPLPPPPAEVVPVSVASIFNTPPPPPASSSETLRPRQRWPLLVALAAAVAVAAVVLLVVLRLQQPPPAPPPEEEEPSPMWVPAPAPQRPVTPRPRGPGQAPQAPQGQAPPGQAAPGQAP